MKLVFTHVRPGRLASGGWTLYEYRYFDEYIPVPYLRHLRRFVRRVWPPIKMKNGRGFVFKTQAAAWRAYMNGHYWRSA